jgi:hypothetical protein
MARYDRELYSRNFARLLNRALKIGGGDAVKALEWLDRKYKPLWAVLFSKHRAEMSDAYMDVREHIVKRMKESSGAGELGSGGERKEIGD